MAAVTIQADRGISLQGQLSFGRGGIQNGSFNRKVAIGNTFGNTVGDMFIDVDGVSRLRMPFNTTLRLLGTLYVMSNSTGVIVQTLQPVFDHTFVTSGAGVTTITANVVAVGFTVTKTNIPNNIGGTEDVINIILAAPGVTVRGYLDAQILDQSQVAGAANTRQAAAASLVQAGRY